MFPSAFVILPSLTPGAVLFGKCLKVTVNVPVEPEVPATSVKFNPIGFPLESMSSASYVIVPIEDPKK